MSTVGFNSILAREETFARLKVVFETHGFALRSDGKRLWFERQVKKGAYAVVAVDVRGTKQKSAHVKLQVQWPRTAGFGHPARRAEEQLLSDLKVVCSKNPGDRFQLPEGPFPSIKSYLTPYPRLGSNPEITRTHAPRRVIEERRSAFTNLSQDLLRTRLEAFAQGYTWQEIRPTENAWNFRRGTGLGRSLELPMDQWSARLRVEAIPNPTGDLQVSARIRVSHTFAWSSMFRQKAIVAAEINALMAFLQTGQPPRFDLPASALFASETAHRQDRIRAGAAIAITLACAVLFRNHLWVSLIPLLIGIITYYGYKTETRIQFGAPAFDYEETVPIAARWAASEASLNDTDPEDLDEVAESG